MTMEEFLAKLSLPVDFTRRGFLKTSGALAALGVVSQASAQEGVHPYIILENAKGLILGDPNICVTCHRCELACTEFNEGKTDFRLTRIKIERNQAHGLHGTNLMPTERGTWGNGVGIQDTCRQCPHPVPCANACPAGAIQLSPNTKARIVIQERCVGCHLCQKACPWDMMTFDYEINKASKCHLCNGDPRCVKSCPASALRFIPWFDRSHDEARRAPHGYLPQENAAECSICHR